MAHATVRATIIPEIVRLICERYGWSEDVALDRFYTSSTGESFADDSTGLYGQSALFNYGLFVDEYENAEKKQK